MDAIPNPRPQAVDGVMGIDDVRKARYAMIHGDIKAGNVVYDYLGMLLDAARLNDGKLVELQGKVL